MDRGLVKEILREILSEEPKETSKGFNFKCLVCGDSKKSKSKRRGWVLFKNDMATYYCHNCFCSKSFNNFVKEYHPDLFKKYLQKTIRERFKKNYNLGVVLATEFQGKKVKNYDNLSKEIIPHSFPLLKKNVTGICKKELQQRAIELVRERKIPKEFYKDFRICYKYDNEELKYFKDRLIIPYYDADRKMYCFSARTMFDEVPKYLTWNRDNIKIFNFYNVDKSLPVLIFEGAIDAMFMPNSIALTGVTSMDSEAFKLVKKTFPNRIWVTDNQWCDNTGMKIAKQLAKAGERVFVYPRQWRRWKDMNEIILSSNLTSEATYSIILNNEYKGLTATTKLKLM